MSYSCTCRSARKASSPASRSACVGKLATTFNRSLSKWYFRKLPVNGTGDPSSTWSMYVGNPIPSVALRPTHFAANFVARYKLPSKQAAVCSYTCPKTWLSSSRELQSGVSSMCGVDHVTNPLPTSNDVRISCHSAVPAWSYCNY